MFLINIRLNKCVIKLFLKMLERWESVPDCYKNQETCDKAVDNYPHAIKFVSEYCKTQKMCDKIADNHPSAMQFLAECYKKQQMCYKTVNTCFFVFNCIPDQYETQEICDIALSLYPFLIIYCPDQYKTQIMCDESVDDSLAALKIIPDWFVTCKMIKKFYTALYADDGSVFFDEDSGDVTFGCNENGIPSVNLNNNNLDNNFDKDDPDIIILIRLLAWHSKF